MAESDEFGRRRFTVDPSDVGGSIEAILASVKSAASKPLDAEDNGHGRVRKLLSLRASMLKPRDFSEGDIVRFKPGLNITRIANLCICMKVYPEGEGPVGDVKDHGNPHFNQRQDVVIGVLTDDNFFYEYHDDSRRLERVPDDELV